jgi:hypothetical protein
LACKFRASVNFDDWIMEYHEYRTGAKARFLVELDGRLEAALFDG